MKKYITILLSLICILSLTACDKDNTYEINITVILLPFRAKCKVSVKLPGNIDRGSSLGLSFKAKAGK